MYCFTSTDKVHVELHFQVRSQIHVRDRKISLLHDAAMNILKQVMGL